MNHKVIADQERAVAHPAPLTTPRWYQSPRRIALRLVVVLMVGVAVALTTLWWRLTDAPLSLPQQMQSRIEARIDAAMAANHVTVGDMVLALPEGGRAPAIEFRDVAMVDATGAERAAFPAVRVRLAPGPLLRGEVRPRRVTITGPGMTLRREPSGRFDVNFMSGTSSAVVSEMTLTETMARLDAMFAAPVFAELREVVATGATLSMVDADLGQVLRVQNATARLTRGGEGLALVVDGQVSGRRDATVEMAFSRAVGLGETEIAMRFDNLGARDLAQADPALAWLDLLQAPITGGLTARMGDDGTVAEFGGNIRIGAGQVDLGAETAPLGFEGVDATLDYVAARRRMEFGQLRIEARDLTFTAAGHVDMSEDANQYVGQMRLTGIEANPGGLFEAPLIVDGAAVDLRLTLSPRIRLEIGQAVLHDGSLRLTAQSDVVVREDGLDLSLDVQVPEASLETVLSYWPVSAAPQARVWVADRVSDAQFRGVDFALRRHADGTGAQLLQFDFEDARIQPFAVGLPIVDAAGYFQLDGTRLVARLDQGTMVAPGADQPVSLARSEIVIPDVRPRGPDAEFRIAVAGGLNGLLHVLDAPPLSVFQDAEITPDRIGSGMVEAQLDLSMPLGPRAPGAPPLDDVLLRAEGIVTDFRADELVPGSLLQADRLAVSITPDGPGMPADLAVSGRARFDGVPMAGVWQRRIGPGAPPGSSIEAGAPLTRQALADLGVDLPTWLLSGQGAADVALDLRPDAPPRLTVRSDLDGSVLAIPALGWRLGAGQTGDLRAEIRLGPDPAVTALAIEAGGLTLDGRVALLDGGGLDRLVATRFRLGTWLDVEGALIGRGGEAPAIEITGGVLDLRSAPTFESGGGPAASGPLTVALERLQIADGIALTGVRADLQTGGGLRGPFSGSVNASAPVSGVLVSGPEGTSVRVASQDGGAVMRAAGIYRNAYGGDMTLLLQATGETGVYEGRLEVDGPRLRDAPAFAELLSLISVVGLLEQLDGEGINLGEVDARFRLSPERIALREGTAVGPSMGLSMDGIYDVGSRRFDMHGVISPIYIVNGLFGALFAPRREGLFGFSYRLTGTPGAADVSVNPLSILTPGIFREIFRAPPPDFGEEGRAP